MCVGKPFMQKNQLLNESQIPFLSLFQLRCLVVSTYALKLPLLPLAFLFHNEKKMRGRRGRRGKGEERYDKMEEESRMRKSTW